MKKKRVKEETKLIGGSPHVRVECFKCHCKIWVNEGRRGRSGEFVELCSDCNGGRLTTRFRERLPDKSLGVDIRYHGGAES